MTAQIAPLTERKAWKALEAHHKNVRDLHLRKLFADDPKRGERMTAEAVGLYLGLFEEPHHRRNPQAAFATGGGIGFARAHRRHVPG